MVSMRTRTSWFRGLVALNLALALPAAGCDSSDSPSIASSENGSPAGLNKKGPSSNAGPAMPEDPQHQSFAKAIRAQPPANALPPHKTLTGKSVGKIFTEVEKLWPEIRFTDGQGRKLQYQARIETDLGVLELELLPEIAPNHVRSFVALAKVGYYDGLRFENRIGAPTTPPPHLIEAGSPEGDGKELASVGYWLNSEIPMKNDKPAIHHETGVVGAGRGPEPDSDGCRFYISLSAAPALDGEYTIFGRVTRGLDVAQRIFELPVHDAQADAAFLKPPTIRKVTISTQALEKSP